MAEPERTKRPFTRRKQLEKDLAHVSEEMYKRNFELAQTNQTLLLLRTIDTLVLASQDSLQVLCNQITEAIVDNSEFSFAAILTKAADQSHLQLSGFKSENIQPKDKIDIPVIHLEGSDKLLKSLGKTPKLVHVAGHTDEAIAKFLGCSVAQTQTLKQKLNLTSLYLNPLMARQHLVGLMVVDAAKKTGASSQNDLIDRLSEAVGVAIDNKLLFEENQHVVSELKKSNEKLKALDETKDEFISMASHQLRTPLTSVKGYVSMVMEGDAGKISAAQKKLLDQAFTSSQRMVYLIADLLNVSRLRTGKFVIEAKPTNLADVVEGEIGQLVETAKARKLELKYDKPKDFPILNLDETKIRQVIMNFIDNAIYYTPAGGHIAVALKDGDGQVEYTVTDDGIGIPTADQHHLFTKFYRAGNARKARPDGTGLGLFMAKKVIVAQGGAIIFKSAEGKGSTFGFTFPKQKLKASQPA